MFSQQWIDESFLVLAVRMEQLFYPTHVSTNQDCSLEDEIGNG